MRYMKAAALLFFATATITAYAQSFETVGIFNGKNGGFPANMSPIQGPDGSIYGTASYGGSSEGLSGVLFQLKPNDKISEYSFCRRPMHGTCPDGSAPDGTLFLSLDGNLYGTTSAGGTNNMGSVFKIAYGGVLTTLYNFCGGCGDGVDPEAGLIQATDGNFYGTTTQGGVNSAGTVFKMTPTGAFTTLHSFDFTDGYYPVAGLVQATDGDLYGTTTSAGPLQLKGGTIFRITLGGTLSTVYDFCSQPGCSDGGAPYGQLIQATDGNFYGTTEFGGDPICENGCGTIFRLTPDGALTTLYNFCSQPSCADGNSPAGGLVQANDGNFYGTTGLGGVRNGGTVFSMTSEGVLTTLYSFCPTGNGCEDGDNPQATLLQATNGRFYGSTNEGGEDGCQSNGCGTIFSLDMGLEPFVAFVRSYGKVGQTGGILGQGFTGTTSVAINGIAATFTVISDTFLKATVPAGASTGYVTVTTPSGTLTSNGPFHVIP